MRNNNFIIIAMIFIVSLLCISAVSAADDSASDIVADTSDEIVLEESIDDASLKDSQSEENVLKANPSSSEPNFKYLDSLVNSAASEIDLQFDIYYKSTDNLKDGIVIDHDLTINGNNHIIDGKGSARIFHVTSNATVTFNGINFVNGSTANTGYGAAIWAEKSTVKAINCNFIGNNASFGGAVAYVDCENCNFTNNSVNDWGGAMYWGKATNCSFLENSAKSWGGGIYGSTAIDCNFTNNYISGSDDYTYGGAMSRSTGINCTFIGNKARISGGATYICDVIDCTFINCSSYYGGALSLSNAINCIFIHNTAEGEGGAAYNINATNCVFINNSAKNYGGALSNSSAVNCNFTGNTAINNYGGAIYVSDATNCIFTNNSAKRAGAIYEGTAIKCTFSLNSAESWAGALEECTAINCAFLNNSAPYGGATAYCTAINCNFTGNSAFDNCGGAAYVTNATNCIFTNNTAPLGGAFDRGFAINCIFKENTARKGGAMYKGTAIECIFNQNTASQDGGATYLSNASDCIFSENIASGKGGALANGAAENCIFTNNTANYGGAIYNATAANSNFIDNNAEFAGAMYRSSASNCNFTNNTAAENGGAINEGNATDCIFTGNSAKIGGAISNGTAVNCNFTNNTALENGGAAADVNSKNGIFTGNSAKIGGAMYGGASKNSTFTFNMAENGTYDMYNVDSHELGNTFNVPIFDASSLNTTCDNKDNFNFTLTFNNQEFNDINTIISIYKDGEFVDNCTALTGQGWTVDLPAGKYLVLLSIPNSNVLPACLAINVAKYSTNIAANDVSTIYNEDNYLVVNLTDGKGRALSGVEVSITLDSTEKYTSDENGQIKINVAKLLPRAYDAVIRFEGNENYSESFQTVKVTVEKISTNIRASDVSTIYNEDNYLVVNLTDVDGNALSGVEVNVTLGSAKSYTTDEKGLIKINVANLVPKAYDANISFAGNDYYSESSASAKVSVNKISTKLTSTAVSTIYNKNKYLVIKLADVDGKALAGVKVKVTLGSAKSYTTDKNGQIKINVGKLVPKTYNAKISFAGNTNYAASSKTVKVTVKKAAVKMTAKNKAFKLKANVKKYAIVLKNNVKKAIKGVKVTLKVNKKTYNAKTNKKGKAVFKIKNLKKKGTYNTVIRFAGNKYYKKVSKKVKISVKK